MFKKNQKGFTLIELTVVIAIIGVLAIITVPNYYQSIKKAKYETAVSTIVTLIKEARNMSIIGNLTKSGSDLIAQTGGYGVYLKIFSTGSTIISFQDLDTDNLYSSDNDTILSIYTLPKEILIKSMSGTKATDYTASTETNASFSEATILFIPPQGKTILNENNKTKELIDFFLQLERYDSNKSKKLKINRISGFLETE